MGVPIALGYREDAASGAQIIDGGLRFDSAKSHYLTRTPGSAGNRKTWTWSGWVKRCKLGASQYIFESRTGVSDTTIMNLSFNASDQLQVVNYSYFPLISSSVYRDISAWMHIVWTLDTTQATVSNRMKLYVNGIEITAFGTDNRSSLTQSSDQAINQTAVHYIGGQNYADFILSNLYLIDGQALGPEYFGYTDPLTNVWRPKKFKPAGTPNDGRTFSDPGNITNFGNINSDNPENAFNGQPGNYWNVYNNDGNTSGTTTPTSRVSRVIFNPPLTNVTKLEILGWTGAGASPNGKIYINGVNDPYLVSATSATWLDLTSKVTSGIVTSIAHGTGSTNGNLIEIIKVNGVPLINGVNDPGGVGQNGFYLPFDGSAPIGQDQSGRGNNWTPVNFGGSTSLEKATGALPILNTDGGGKVARVGVRTDANASSLVLALPLVGIRSDFSNAVNSGTTNKTVTAVGNVSASSVQSNFYGGSFYFDGTGDYLSIPDNNDFAFGSGNFTIEAWIYPTSYGNFPLITGQYGSTTSSRSHFFSLGGSNSSTLNFYWYDAAGNGDNIIAGSVALNKWSHVSAVRNGNTFAIYVDGVQVGSKTSTVTTLNDSTDDLRIGQDDDGGSPYNFTGYIQDVRIYKGLAKYTSNFIPASTDPDIVPDSPSGVSYSSNVALVPSTDGAVAFDGSGDYLSLSDNTDFQFGTGNLTVEAFVYPTSSSDGFIFDNRDTTIGNALPGIGFGVGSNTPRLLLTGAGPILTANRSLINNVWQHVAVVKSSGTFTIYIDGVQSGSTADATNLTSDSAFIAGAFGGGSNYFPGFISNLHIVKGTALYTSNFTPPSRPINSVANTKLLCCKSPTSATAFDVSPGTITANGNAAATNFNPFTVNINTQRGKQSGYATLNPLDKHSTITLANGNLDVTASDTNNWYKVKATIAVSSGKWYWECGNEMVGGVGSGAIGVCEQTVSTTNYVGYESNSYSYYNLNGNKINNTNSSSYGSTFSTGDVIGVALDMDAGTITFYKNGVSQGVAFTGISGTYTPAFSSQVNYRLYTNFGQKPFKFPPPPGFQPLTLANTSRPTIVRPDQYVGIVTYTGNGTSQTLNVGFKPDFVWMKSRTDVANSHILQDTVRGTNKFLISNSANQESTDSTVIQSFNSNGFTIGNGGSVNNNGSSFVAWAWKAGGNSNTFNIDDIGYASASAAGLTGGTVTPSGASVNTKSGFSIVSFTAQASGSASIPHGLGNTPAFIIVKSRAQTYSWLVYHKNLTSNAYYLILNSTAAQDNTSNAWNSTSPTSSVFTLGSTYAGGGNTVAYLWAEIPGFSKALSWTGNGSADGPMLNCGFLPRFFIAKRTDAANDWWMWDTARSNTGNPVDEWLSPNRSDAEYANDADFDFISNGIKIRTTSATVNASGGTYIGFAFAEAPTINLYGAQANAR